MIIDSYKIISEEGVKNINHNPNLRLLNDFALKEGLCYSVDKVLYINHGKNTVKSALFYIIIDPRLLFPFSFDVCNYLTRILCIYVYYIYNTYIIYTYIYITSANHVYILDVLMPI